MAYVPFDKLTVPTASFAITSSVALSAITSSVALSAITASFAITSSVALSAISASWAPSSNSLDTGSLQDVTATDFIKIRDGTITRDSNGYILSIQKTGGRTIEFTRNIDNFITSSYDGIRTTTLTRNVNNQLISWNIV